MRIISNLSLSVLAVSSLALTGCQQFSKPQLDPNSVQVESNQQFSLEGKIGVRTPQQTGSAFFTWVQQQQQFDIELSGILGAGKTQITGRPGQVSLNSAKTGLIQAETPEELLKTATGWEAPITHLVNWVQAKPATTQAKIQRDANKRAVQIIEDGWHVDLSYNQQATMPNRLVLKQTLENGAENRITMVIQNR